MTAYRLHFERATLSRAAKASAGMIGDARLFASTFTMDVQAPEHPPRRRPAAAERSTTSACICINAARHLFRAEPTEVFAATAGRKGCVEESASCTLRFPGDRLATFCVSFGSGKTSQYRVIGTRGSVHVEPGYELAERPRAARAPRREGAHAQVPRSATSSRPSSCISPIAS